MDPVGAAATTKDMRTLLLLPLLAACHGKDGDTGPADTGEPANPAPVWVALFTPVEHGYLRSTCTITVDVYDGNDGSVLIGSFSFASRGGEWAGMELAEDLLYSASALDHDCIAASDEEAYPSGAFSLAKDGLMVFWYTGTQRGFDTEVQGEDFQRGVGYAEVEKGTDPAEWISFAEGQGVTATAQDDTNLTWDLSFDRDRSVAEALSAVSTFERITWAQPVWVREPSWW